MESKKWRRANVLAVDDQPANLVALDAVLSDCNLIRASSGEEALSILRSRFDIDLVLMDVQMPVMDGFETSARIKKLPGCEDIPIVFLTAVYHEDPFVKQGYEVGAVDYFSKPFDPELLRVKVGIYASFRQKADLLKEWARQIEESEELLRAGQQLSELAEQLRIGVIVTDPDGSIRGVNSEAGDRRALDWWDGEGRLVAGRSSSLAKAIQHRETAHETCDIRAADGTQRSVLCSASPLREPDGELSGFVIVLRDVTERRRMERELQRHIQKIAPVGC